MIELPFQSKRIHVRPGYFMNVHVSGNPRGRPVVFIHGRASSFETWQHQLKAFQNDGRFQIIAYDLNGHGQSDYESHASVAEHAEDLDNLLEELNIRGPVDLVGHSDGAAIAQTFALDHPTLVRKMVLVAGYDRPPVDVRTKNKIALGLYKLSRISNFSDRFYDKLLGIMDAKPLRVSDRPPELGVLMEHFDAFNRFNVRNKVPRALRPHTLLVCSQIDPHAAIGQQRLAKKWDALQYTVGRDTHSPHLERPEQVNRHLLHFLSSG